MNLFSLTEYVRLLEGTYELVTENQDADKIIDCFSEETRNVLNEDEQNALIYEMTGCCICEFKEYTEIWFTKSSAPASIHAEYFKYRGE